MPDVRLASLPLPGELLRRYGRPAKKHFGQNFIVDPSVLDRVVDAAGIGEGHSVLEIGPGPGTLTVRLLRAGARVSAVELDDDAVSHLDAELAPLAPLIVRRGDANSDDLLESVPADLDAVVGNLPYHVATAILFRLLDVVRPPRMALMFQREVADRLVCTGAARDFGPLGVAANLRYDTRMAMRLRPGAFLPPPKVESAVVTFVRRAVPRVDPDGELWLRALARHVFEKRRKMLRVSLSGFVGDPQAALEEAGVDPTARPEALSLDAMISLAEACRRCRSVDANDLAGLGAAAVRLRATLVAAQRSG